jgi:hypothetical protein
VPVPPQPSGSVPQSSPVGQAVGVQTQLLPVQVKPVGQPPINGPQVTEPPQKFAIVPQFWLLLHVVAVHPH